MTINQLPINNYRTFIYIVIAYLIKSIYIYNIYIIYFQLIFLVSQLFMHLRILPYCIPFITIGYFINMTLGDILYLSIIITEYILLLRQIILWQINIIYCLITICFNINDIVLFFIIHIFLYLNNTERYYQNESKNLILYTFITIIIVKYIIYVTPYLDHLYYLEPLTIIVFCYFYLIITYTRKIKDYQIYRLINIITILLLVYHANIHLYYISLLLLAILLFNYFFCINTLFYINLDLLHIFIPLFLMHDTQYHLLAITIFIYTTLYKNIVFIYNLSYTHTICCTIISNYILIYFFHHTNYLFLAYLNIFILLIHTLLDFINNEYVYKKNKINEKLLRIKHLYKLKHTDEKLFINFNNEPNKKNIFDIMDFFNNSDFDNIIIDEEKKKIHNIIYASQTYINKLNHLPLDVIIQNIIEKRNQYITDSPFQITQNNTHHRFSYMLFLTQMMSIIFMILKDFIHISITDSNIQIHFNMKLTNKLNKFLFNELEKLMLFYNIPHIFINDTLQITITRKKEYKPNYYLLYVNIFILFDSINNIIRLKAETLHNITIEQKTQDMSLQDIIKYFKHKIF